MVRYVREMELNEATYYYFALLLSVVIMEALSPAKAVAGVELRTGKYRVVIDVT